MNLEVWPEEVMLLDTQVLMFFVPFPAFLFAFSAKISTDLRRRLASREIFSITGTFLKGSS